MTANGIPLDKAYLTAIWLETLFYEANLMLFLTYLIIMHYKRRYSPLAYPILLAAIAMFLLSTTHVSLGFYRLVEGFIYRRNTPEGPAGFFSDVSLTHNVVKVGLHTINTILGDGIVVWRCYVIWGKTWKVCIVPGLLMLASSICGLGQAIAFVQAKNASNVFNENLERWNGALFTLTLITNVLVTVLIVYKILKMKLLNETTLNPRMSPKTPTSSFYTRVLITVIESGLIYSSALVIEIILYLVNNNAFYIVYNPIAQMTALMPTAIIVLSTLRLTMSDLHFNRRINLREESSDLKHGSNSEFEGTV